MRRALHRSQPLHSSRIGKAEGSHISVRPRLLGCPLDGVKSVAALVFVRPQFATGSVPATHILYDNRISTLDCAVKDRIFLLREVLAVGRAINENREWPNSFGPKDVGTEQNSAAHMGMATFCSKLKSLGGGCCAIAQVSAAMTQRT